MIERTLRRADFPAWYRVIAPSYAHIPCSGMGAAREGGRFNRPGQEALYLALEDSTALAEYKRDNPWLPPGTICTFFVDSLRVADFSAGFDPNQWDSIWADFQVEWRNERFGQRNEPPTWYMGDDVLAAGLDGLMFPSQASPGGTNLVIYDSSRRRKSELAVYDPDQRLSPKAGK